MVLNETLQGIQLQMVKPIAENISNAVIYTPPSPELANQFGNLLIGGAVILGILLVWATIFVIGGIKNADRD